MKLITESNDTEGILKKKLSKVDIETDLESTLSELKEMIDIMNENFGIGLASSQVGINKAMFIFTLNGKVEFAINPQILKYSQQKSTMVEGCLSYPNKHVSVTRPSEILVRYHNGKKVVTIKLMGMNSKVFQHEFSHLQGQCIVGK
jgi:peptide deformylase